MTTGTARRRVLKGMLNGAAVSVALPFLDCFLDDNGTALASGAPLPVRFGTWFWGCGVTPQRFFPAQTGGSYEIPPEMAGLAKFRKDLTILSGFNTLLDGAPNFCHYSGQYAILTGAAPVTKERLEGPTFDTAIAAKIGNDTRFRSLEISVTGDPRDIYSRPAPTVTNPAEVSPVAFYKRIFGEEFKDPNAADFTPDPKIMVRQSVLSAVKEQHDDLIRRIGSADRERLDQYLTSVRQIEQQLALQLQKPPPAEACTVPADAKEERPASDIATSAKNHRLFAELLAMALACNQTRVFNLVFSASASTLRKPGSTTTHHQMTHEEPIDDKLGIQPTCTFYVDQSLTAWAQFLDVMGSIREGDGTLLDRSLIFALSDTQFAKIHSLNGIPMMIAGKAGGRIRQGQHIAGNGDPVTRVGLTIQQIMGVTVEKFGAKSMETKKPIGEIIA